LFVSANWSAVPGERRPDGMRKMALAWSKLSDAERATWQARSDGEFENQRVAALQWGIKVRGLRGAASHGPAVDGAASHGPAVLDGAAQCLPATITFGDFKVDGSLGSGSFGKVIQATSLSTGRRVALKVFQEQHARDLERELRMYQAVSVRSDGDTVQDGFRASYFVDIVGYCATGPFPWLGLQMRGQSLHEHLRKHGPMVHGGGPGAVFRQLAAALAHMHKRNIAHLDLKTGNLLWDAADRHLHIIDLGMAEKFPAVELYHGEYCTPPYRPPELWGAAAVEHRRYLGPPVDIWSAGCVMYEVTTAKFLLYPRSKKETVLSCVRAWCAGYGWMCRSQQPSSEASEAAQVKLLKAPPRWQKVVLQCCHPEPEQRFMPSLVMP